MATTAPSIVNKVWNYAHVLRNDGAQNFLAADSLRSVTSADFDEDGRSDLAVAHSSSFSYFWRPNYPEGLSVLLGNGDGAFQAAKDYSVGDF